MRSKVKRLTEKPDKDPAKLPRTEKEQDMVSLSDFLRDDYSPTGSFLTVRGSSASVLSIDTNPDLGVPSPPKALNGIRQRLGLNVDDDELDTGYGNEYDTLLASPSRGRRTGRTLLARTSSIISNYSALLSPRRDSDSSHDTEEQDDDDRVSSKNSSPRRPNEQIRSFTSNVPSTIHDSQPRPTSSIYSTQSSSALVPASSARDSASTRGATWPRQKIIPGTQSTPFFEPSELEEIMAPLKVDFMRKQADKLEQAKAAYDQLNEQLMSELPQLIDLRCVSSLSFPIPHQPREPTTNHCLFQTESPTSTPHSKLWSKSNYASARKLTAAWRKCNSTSTLRLATSMLVVISMHGWKMCWARFAS